jgi:AraC-binding-like domain
MNGGLGRRGPRRQTIWTRATGWGSGSCYKSRTQGGFGGCRHPDRILHSFVSRRTASASGSEYRFGARSSGAKWCTCDIEPIWSQPFEAAAVVYTLPGLRSTLFASSATRNRRAGSMLADGDDAVVLLTSLRGTLAVSQGERDLTLRPGDSTLFLHAEPALVAHSQIRYRASSFRARRSPYS